MANHNLRSGYTTGSCAAAAAKAAAVCLITGKAPGQVMLDLSAGGRALWIPTAVPADDTSFGEMCSHGRSFRVQKDAGDDPDVTNGSWIYARVCPISEEEYARRAVSGKGYPLEGKPAIYLNGGCGIGLVTRKGLSCPVGHYAFNPVPREMIARAVREVCAAAGYRDPLLVTVAIPGGEELAQKTFNPKLGIMGGLSVLGTTGIVRPMSEEALQDTIRLELHMNVVSGNRQIVMTPGNYGETFLGEWMKLPAGKAVVCSNFVKDSVVMAAEEGIERILFVGHMGKLIKVAAGLENTHSRYGDKRMETICGILSQMPCGMEPELQRTVMACNTTDEALNCLVTADRNLAQQVMEETAGAVKAQMEKWTGGKVAVETVVFSSALGLVGHTALAAEYRDRIMEKVHI